MTTPLTILLVLFVIYIVAMSVKFRQTPPRSISETYYLLGGQDRNGWIFTIWLMAIGIMCCLLPSEWMFVSGSSFVFAAVAAQYKDRITNRVHFIGAGLGYVLALSIINPFLIAGTVVGCVAISSKKGLETKIWWIEIYAFIVVWIGLLIKFYEG